MDAVPVLVGVGQVLQQLDNPLEADEPLQMMISALNQAGADSGAPHLLQRADSIYVLKGIWDYGDPGSEIARRLGTGPAETIGTPVGGNYAQSCIIDAARRIQQSPEKVVLITGAENGRSRMQAERLGMVLQATEVPGQPARTLGDDKPMVHQAERVRGITVAGIMYAIIESTIRFARGESLPEHVNRISGLWARFNAVAGANPHAWIRHPYSARDIAHPGPQNPMVAYPYTRLMNANPRVDMAAGLLMCSLETAEKAGVPEGKRVFLHAATEASDSQFAATRAEFHRSPAMRFCGRRVLDLAGKTAESVDYIDLYSCFPSAVQIAAAELGIPEERNLTVTGGLTFGGGPLNSYVLHAVARMVEVLRADRGASGLVTGNGGWLAKHAFGVYSTEHPVDGFQYENLQAQADACPIREAVIDWEGPVTVEGYTVAYREGEPGTGYAACLLDDGGRTWGIVEDQTVLRAMVSGEFCGRRGHLDGCGNLTF